jgi:hypothetical protein
MIPPNGGATYRRKGAAGADANHTCAHDGCGYRAAPHHTGALRGLQRIDKQNST